MSLELVDVNCNVCKKTFGYYGPEKEYYYCSTFCSEKDAVNKDGNAKTKGTIPWKRQSVATYQKAKETSAISKARKKTESVTIGTQERGDQPKVLIRKKNTIKAEKEILLPEMKEESKECSQIQSMQPSSENMVEQTIITIEKKAISEELNTKEKTEIMKINCIENGMQEIEKMNLPKLKLENELIDQTYSPTISSKELILEVSQSTRQLNDSAKYVMERLILTNSDKTIKSTETIIKCAKTVKELIKVKLELSKFARTVTKDNMHTDLTASESCGKKAIH